MRRVAERKDSIHSVFNSTSILLIYWDILFERFLIFVAKAIYHV